MNQTGHLSFAQRIAPALTLILLAPLIAEVLPGSTRMSSIFVFPIEIGVWGVGALFIREIVRRRHLGWRGMLLLSLVLALAEECLIQQSSLAPLVFSIQKGGEHYARAGGINYLYLLWALGYESVFVVFVPVAIAELVFRDRRTLPWMSRGGMILAAVYSLAACFLAWFTWTQIARIKIFHVPPYIPPAWQVATAIAVMVVLVLLALGRHAEPATSPSRPPSWWLAGAFAAVLAFLWYGLVILAFGARPDFPPAAAIVAGVLMAVVALSVFPRWSASTGWNDAHHFVVATGALVATMLIGFVGFIGASALDFYGKLIADLLAAVWLCFLGRTVFRNMRAQKTPA